MKDEQLLAVITTNKEAIGGDIPIFFASSPEEQDRIASILSQVLKAMIHDIGNGVYIVVKH